MLYSDVRSARGRKERGRGMERKGRMRRAPGGEGGGRRKRNGELEEACV